MDKILRNFMQLVVIALFIIIAYIEGPKLFSTKKHEMILYYRMMCPHCQKVEEFIKSNRLEDRFIIQKREVAVSNPSSIQELAARARHCGIKDTTLTVPFLWTGKECLAGDKTIIDFLSQQMRK